MKNMKTGTYFIGDESYNFSFGTDLSAYDKTIFVRTVVDTLVDEDNYDSVIRDMIFDFTIVIQFTDIDTSFTKSVDNNGEAIPALVSIEQFLEETNVVDIVKANMEYGLLEQLNNAVNKSIEYRTGIHPSPLADSIASILSTLERKINEFDMGSMMDMAQKFASITGDLNVDSVVNAYMNSDVHKKNLEEVADSKKNKKRKKNEIKIDENLGEAVRTIVEENKAEKTNG